MKAEKHGRKKCIWLVISVFLCFVTAGLILLLSFVYRVHHVPSDKMRDADIAALSQGDYDTVLLSMYVPEAFDTRDFESFRGISAVQARHTFVNLADIGDYLEQSFSCNSNLSNVYIGIDPFAVSGMYGYHTSLYAMDYRRYLTEYVQAHDDVLFEILVPAYSMDYLRTLSDSKYTELINAYRNLVNLYMTYDNVVIYFAGHEEWLIANPGNYDSSTSLTPSILRLLVVYTMGSDKYVLAPGNMEERFGKITKLVQESPVIYPDLSEWCMVFFGDSTFEYNAGSRSVSGVVGNLSGAQVYNCSQGGIPATEDPEAMLSFNRMVALFLEQDMSGLEEAANFKLGLTEYMQDNHEGKKNCFILDYGLNDYFGGHPVENPEDSFDIETYAGALRTGISTLKEAYPEAVILLLTPTYTSYFSNGTGINGEAGGVLTDYVEAAVNVARDMDVICINNYADSGINADTVGLYLADGCHPNETGALLLGRHILEEMKGIIANER